jgi:F0F1-type ATP synthase gamma subunit
MSDKNKGNKDLKGFEEVMDWVDYDNPAIDKNKQRKKKHDPYDLYNFLELENTRLQKIEIFFNDKVQNLSENPTTKKLCDIQQNQIDQTKKQLWDTLHASNSIYLKNLRLVFNKVFS